MNMSRKTFCLIVDGNYHVKSIRGPSYGDAIFTVPSVLTVPVGSGLTINRKIRMSFNGKMAVVLYGGKGPGEDELDERRVRELKSLGYLQ